MNGEVNHLIVSSIALILISCSTIVNSYYAFPNLMNTVSTDSKWYGVDYDWPGSTSRALLKSSGKFASKNNIATRAAIYRDSTFLAFPRFRSGIPATLVRAKLKRGSCSPTFEPFPCWAMQEESKCSAIQSAVDITLDASDILWVLDSGAINTLEKEPVQTCSPKVLAFNVKNGKLVKTITFEGLINKNSRLQYLAVDYGRDGRAFVYVSDAASRALIIYDVQASKGYRIILPKSVSEGCKKKDVLYLALTQKPNAPGVLYFTYLCSNKMFSIKTEYLRDARTSGKIEDVGDKADKLVIIGADGNSIFFRYEGQSEIYKWDADTKFDRSNFKVVHKSESCVLSTHIFPDYRNSKIKALESNFPDYIEGKAGCGALQQIKALEGC